MCKKIALRVTFRTSLSSAGDRSGTAGPADARVRFLKGCLRRAPECLDEDV